MMIVTQIADALLAPRARSTGASERITERLFANKTELTDCAQRRVAIETRLKTQIDSIRF